MLLHLLIKRGWLQETFLFLVRILSRLIWEPKESLIRLRYIYSSSGKGWLSYNIRRICLKLELKGFREEIQVLIKFRILQVIIVLIWISFLKELRMLIKGVILFKIWRAYLRWESLFRELKNIFNLIFLLI
jgi:hypothetical protein